MKNSKQRIFSLVLCALFSAITAVISQISIPTPFGIPLTFQIFAISLCGFILGSKYALLSVFLYVMMGAVGLPVFYGFRGGITAIIGDMTGGFIIGFIPLAALCGVRKYVYWSKNGKLSSLFVGFIGLIICHICGAAVYSALTNISFFASLAITSLPFIFKDAILLLSAFLITPRILSAISKSGFKL